MFRDVDSGVWNTTLGEEAWANERAREMATAAFDSGDFNALEGWASEEKPFVFATFLTKLMALEANTPQLRPLLEELRGQFIDTMQYVYEDDAWMELEDMRKYRETEDA